MFHQHKALSRLEVKLPLMDTAMFHQCKPSHRLEVKILLMEFNHVSPVQSTDGSTTHTVK